MLWAIATTCLSSHLNQACKRQTEKCKAVITMKLGDNGTRSSMRVRHPFEFGAVRFFVSIGHPNTRSQGRFVCFVRRQEVHPLAVTFLLHVLCQSRVRHERFLYRQAIVVEAPARHSLPYSATRGPRTDGGLGLSKRIGAYYA